MKQSTNFINVQDEDGSSVQNHVLRRIHHQFHENGCRTNGFTVVIEHYENYKFTLRQSRVFDRFITVYNVARTVDHIPDKDAARDGL